jgi:hypothetical protein
MEHTRFIGLDIHKERISVAVAESGRSGAVEYHGEIANDPGAISKLCDCLGRSGKPLAFCYEAGPCGYGVHRQLTSLGGLNPRAMLGSLRQPFNHRVDELIRFKPCPPAFIFGEVS